MKRCDKTCMAYIVSTLMEHGHNLFLLLHPFKTDNCRTSIFSILNCSTLNLAKLHCGFQSQKKVPLVIYHEVFTKHEALIFTVKM